MILSALLCCYFSWVVPVSGAGGLDLSGTAAEVLRYSFETEEDRDFDDQPDDWVRRKGPEFPRFVRSMIDRDDGCEGRQSLRFDVNGGQAIYYSPLIEVDPRYIYVFHGAIRTSGLKNDAALISISLLNHKRQRVRRTLSLPVSGTHREWQRVVIGPIEPPPDTRFVVIGCHLVEGREMDIRGQVWFDDLWLGKLPRLSLVSNFQTHFSRPNAPVRVSCLVSGIDPGGSYRLHFELIDSHGTVLEQHDEPLEPSSATNGDSEPPSESEPIVWEVPPRPPGFFRVVAALERDGQRLIERQSTITVMDLVAKSRTNGEFGWSVESPSPDVPPTVLADLASQAGINWLKYPLWSSAHAEGRQRPGEVTSLFERLSQRGITPVGLLSDPPPRLRGKFAANWQGTSEIFVMPSAFWAAWLEPVVARYSSSVRHWQLGADSDPSYVGLPGLAEMLTAVRGEVNRIGRNTVVGVPWDWREPLPTGTGLGQVFLSLNAQPTLSPAELNTALAGSKRMGPTRWVLLSPLARDGYTADERGADLVRRMLAAKIGGADAIFAGDVFDEQHGLLNRDGSPSDLFLPWRTAALTLQGAEYLGQLQLPHGSPNALFVRDGEAVLVVWNEQPQRESAYLGEEVALVDLWGRRTPVTVDPQTREQQFEARPIPQFLCGCSEPIARWMMAVQYRKGKLRSEYGGHEEAVIGANTFPQAVNGQVTIGLPKEWEANRTQWPLQLAPGETFTLPLVLTLPPNASLGVEPTWIEFQITADRPYRFRVNRPYQVGLGDVTISVIDRKLKDGRLEIEQILTNQTDPPEILDFRCSLFVPGEKRQKLSVTNLGRGEDRKFYSLPDADTFRGQELWLRAEQEGGRRVLNYRWRVGNSWDSR